MLGYLYGKRCGSKVAWATRKEGDRPSILLAQATYSPMKVEQSAPKRRHIKLRRRGITQKKAYNIQNTVKVWNQESVRMFIRILVYTLIAVLF